MKYFAFIIAAILLDVVSVDSCGGSHGGHHYEPDYSNFLKVNPNTLKLMYQQGSSGEISVYSNSQWTTATDCDWLEIIPAIGKNNETITVIAKSANDTTCSRTGTIKISGEDGLEQMITVCQQAKPSGDKQ